MSKSKRKRKDIPATSDTSTTTPVPKVVAAVEPPPKVDDESLSLWDTAYDQLKARDRALVEVYEDVLLAKQQSDDEAAALLRGLDERPLERRAQMRNMAEHSLQRMTESRQGKVLERFTVTMTVLASVKGVVDSAVKYIIFSFMISKCLDFPFSNFFPISPLSVRFRFKLCHHGTSFECLTSM